MNPADLCRRQYCDDGEQFMKTCLNIGMIVVMVVFVSAWTPAGAPSPVPPQHTGDGLCGVTSRLQALASSAETETRAPVPSGLIGGVTSDPTVNGDDEEEGGGEEEKEDGGEKEEGDNSGGEERIWDRVKRG
jgi:hypothetical protein